MLRLLMLRLLMLLRMLTPTLMLLGRPATRAQLPY